MAFVRAGSLAQVIREKLVEAILPQPGEPAEKHLALCSVNGEIHVVDGVCPHHGGWLAQGAIHGKTLVCPWHAWEFDCTTGECEFDPRIAIAHHTVEISGDDILVEVTTEPNA